MGWFGTKEYKGTPGVGREHIDYAWNQGTALGQQQQDLGAYLAQRAHEGQPLDFTAASRTLGVGDQLLGQTMDAANGVGPNPALEQLRQTTGENIQRAAGAVASARGVNPAMAARVAATTGAAANQTAAGQAATLAAQQQLAARAQAAGLVGQQAQQQAGLVTSQEQAAAQRIGQQADQLYGQGAQNLQQQQILQTANAAYNSARMAQRAEQNKAQIGVATAAIGGLSQGVGAAAGKAAMAAHGGAVVPGGVEAPGPSSELGRMLMAPPARMAAGGEVMGAREGTVPGRPATGGDSYANDTVQALLSPGEFVVKRTAAQQPGVREALELINAHPEKARDFLSHLVARDGEGFGRVVAARRMSEGGEVKKEPSLVDAVRSWFMAPPGDEAKSKAVAEEAHRSLPEALSARKAIEKKRAQLQALDAQTSER